MAVCTGDRHVDRFGAGDCQVAEPAELPTGASARIIGYLHYEVSTSAWQHQSLRDEMAQARQSQQAILQWSQAVSATLFAAALVAGTGHSSHYVVAAQFVLGVILPAVLLGGALTWSGEMIRLTRIGIFLRSFERYTWDEKAPDLAAGTSLFVSQNVASLHGAVRSRQVSRKAQYWLRWNGNIFWGNVYRILDSFRYHLSISPKHRGPVVASRPGASSDGDDGGTAFQLRNAKSPVITEDDLKKWLITLNAGGGQPSKGMLSRFRL